MTVGRPCVEREHGTEHSKSDEDEGEEHLLYLRGNVVHGGYLVDIHRCGSTEEVDAENTDDEKCRTSHKHQGELHGCIFLVAAAPYADEKIHRDERNLVEHEHGEEVGADEESEHTR